MIRRFSILLPFYVFMGTAVHQRFMPAQTIKYIPLISACIMKFAHLLNWLADILQTGLFLLYTLVNKMLRAYYNDVKLLK